MPDRVTRRPPSEQQQVVEWTGFAYAIAAGYTLPGGTVDDARQEALVGLLSGLRSWRPDGGASRKTFLALAIRRQLITALKLSRRLKHQPLTDAQRVVELDGDTIDVLDSIPDPCGDPHRQLVGRLELREAIATLPLLTELEARCLLGFTVGLSYRDLGAGDDKASWCRIDNAYARGRRKLRAA